MLKHKALLKTFAIPTETSFAYFSLYRDHLLYCKASFISLICVVQTAIMKLSWDPWGKSLVANRVSISLLCRLHMRDITPTRRHKTFHVHQRISSYICSAHGVNVLSRFQCRKNAQTLPPHASVLASKLWRWTVCVTISF